MLISLLGLSDWVNYETSLKTWEEIITINLAFNKYSLHFCWVLRGIERSMNNYVSSGSL